jgi:20S proteasome alpha/beta subunit
LHSISKLKYEKQLRKPPKMTCIIGGKCIDGVVLIADRKSIDR